jgi:hypothetical protein
MARASIVAGLLIAHSESLLYFSLALGVLAARWT